MPDEIFRPSAFKLRHGINNGVQNLAIKQNPPPRWALSVGIIDFTSYFSF
jgi:hypothetical protein